MITHIEIFVRPDHNMFDSGSENRVFVLLRAHERCNLSVGVVRDGW